MGFRLRRIGRRIRRGLRRIGSFAKKAFKTVTKPITGTLKAFGGLAQGLLNKLPFGRAIGGFINNFLQNPLALVSVAGLGGIGALIGAAGSFSDLLGGMRMASRSPAFQNPHGRQNLLNLVAHRHANMHMHVHQHHHHHHC